MADEQKPDSGASGSNGGAGAKDENQKPDPKPTKSVSWEDHKRALDDMHRFKREKEESDAKLSAAEEKSLREKEDWKTLAEREKVRAEKLDADNKKLTDVFLRTHKYGEVKKVAVEMGLRGEAMDDLDLLDIDGVKVEATSSGRYLVHGAKEYVEELKGKKPHWFKKSGPADINAGTGGGAPGVPKKVTADDLVQAERKMKSGQLSKDGFNKLFKEYQVQRKTN